jgi:hypothetical protein
LFVQKQLFGNIFENNLNYSKVLKESILIKRTLLSILIGASTYKRLKGRGKSATRGIVGDFW